MTTHHSASLADPSVVTAKEKNKRNVYFRFPEDIKTARSHCKIKYRFKLLNFLSQLEAEKITKLCLCNAADSSEKLFGGS